MTMRYTNILPVSTKQQFFIFYFLIGKNNFIKERLLHVQRTQRSLKNTKLDSGHHSSQHPRHGSCEALLHQSFVPFRYRQLV